MKERIILAPGANGSELIKNLAMHGVNSFGLRIVGAGELARLSLMRCGIPVTEDFLSSREETVIIAEAVKGEAYFGKTTYSDIREIARAVRCMRTLSERDDEETVMQETLTRGIFPEKNAALFSVYQKYMKILKERKLIDSVSLIRKALRECTTVDAEFSVLREYPLDPLQKALLRKVSGGVIRKSSLPELYGVSDAMLHIDRYRNCYGAPCEVESILADIYSGKSPDRCTVAVTDAVTYGQLFFDYALLYDLPITFGCGIPIINSNPAGLLVLYYHWMTSGFFGSEAVSAMLKSEAFDRAKLNELFPDMDPEFQWDVFYKILGGLRLTNDPEVNKKRMSDFRKAVSEEEALIDPADEKTYRSLLRKKASIPRLQILSEELALPPEEFLSKYAFIRNGFDTNSARLVMDLDLSAKNAICEELKIIRASKADEDTEDMIRNVLKMGIGASGSSEGMLYVTDIRGALSSVRETLYIAGLSASNYPGSPSEDYLLLDTDLEQFEEGGKGFTSEQRLLRKKEDLTALVHLASGLHSKVELSYAGLNVSELKHDNASSMIFELYREEQGTNATSKELEERIEKVSYFEPAVSLTRKVGEAYNEGKKILPAPSDKASETVYLHPDPEQEFSPSSLDEFFRCPRAFFLTRILGIPKPEEEKPFEVIAANESGSLAHFLMEQLGRSKMSLEDFLKLSREAFDRFLAEHPPLVERDADAMREEFSEMMETAYQMDPHGEAVMEEASIRCRHECGVRLVGFPDRIERCEDGSVKIVDFKSGSTVTHVQDDVDTCLQILIYAYILEQNGMKVSGGEYRYLKLGRTVTCRYDEEMKRKLSEKLSVFKKHLDAFDFPIPDQAYAENRKTGDQDPCRYCRFGLICGKGSEGGAENE